MTLHLEYMYQDPPCRPGEIPPALEGLSILSGGGDAHIYGKVMTPGRPPGNGVPAQSCCTGIRDIRRCSISARGCAGWEPSP